MFRNKKYKITTINSPDIRVIEEEKKVEGKREKKQNKEEDQDFMRFIKWVIAWFSMILYLYFTEFFSTPFTWIANFFSLTGNGITKILFAIIQFRNPGECGYDLGSEGILFFLSSTISGSLFTILFLYVLFFPIIALIWSTNNALKKDKPAND